MALISVKINLESGGLANKQELEARWQLEDIIEAKQIGTVIGGGSGRGMMDLTVEVVDPEVGISKLRALADQLGMTDADIYH